MASRKISELDTNGTLRGTDVVPVSDKDGTSTFKLSMDQLVDFINSEADFSPTKVSTIKKEDFPIDSTTTETVFIIDATDNPVVVDLTGINFTLHKNKVLTFKRLNTDDTYDVVLQTNSGNRIDGLESVTIHAQYESVTIVSNGTDGWFIL